ncbi:RraA family protein [Vibrio artabrorum]|uniref:Putative 4-hydroxy-4-methyl-2-oxoglutarate aldolase n=1 Tax=Vibrio artabrorum TaxID=446374 RepID=A0ABT8CMM3_9VIBR|nr:RraA family protein [Vibrio artabrorum]MDN3702664.1 RraA family protein [Vibrio artabrorum]
MLTNKQKELRARLLALDTPAISDALDSLSINGGLLGIQCRINGLKMAGPAFTVKYKPIQFDSQHFKNAGNYIDNVPECSVVLVDNQGRTDCTSWGGILTTKAKLKNLAGTVIFGSVRDLQEINEKEYPLFSAGVYMVSGKNRAVVEATNVPLNINGTTVKDSDWLFGDMNGVLAIPAEHLEEVIYRAEKTEQTELNILGAISGGQNLEEARVQHGYSEPWKEK